MIGGMRKKKKLFDMGGVPDEVMIPGGGFGGGVPSMEEEQKPSFFGKGGTGRGIAGTLGDFLLQNSGFDPVYAPQQRQQQAMDLRQRNAEQARAADMQDWRAKQDYARANPKPQAPKYWERNDGSLMTIGQDGKPTVAYEDPNVPLVPGRDGRFYPQQFAPRKPDGPLVPVDQPVSTPQQSAPTGNVSQVLHPEQYKIVVASLGKAKADEWMKRNNITIGSN